jgi:NadR type nicotinamide-nucleotide adenylyltransferase
LSDSLPRRRGLVLGSFLPYHEGDAQLIRTARAACDEVTVLVCTLPSDPIPGALRFRWVRDSHPDCRVVHVTDVVPRTPDESPAFWRTWTDLVCRSAGPVDLLFTSEDFGQELARRIGAAHNRVDAARALVPISGTEILRDPLAHWEFIPRVVRPYFARRVVLVGSESTGKTTLARKLAREFHTAWVPEYGRDYCEVVPAEELTLDDYGMIAWGQAVWEDERALDANRVLICDTDLHTTATWSDLMLGERPAWLTDAARSRRYDLFILLAPDIPWVQDGLRVLSERRAQHHRLIEQELATAHRNVVRVTGSFEERERAATEAIARLLGNA